MRVMSGTSDLHFVFSSSDVSGFDVIRFELSEGLSQSFRLELELSSFDDGIEATSLLDRPVEFRIERAGVVERRVTGIVTAFEQGESGFRRTRYRAVVASPLARLALRQQCRIFQQLNATEVLTRVLKASAVQV